MNTRKAPGASGAFAVGLGSWQRSWLSLGLFLALALSTLTASAQNAKVEATAKALQKKAMDEDYLGTEFAKAQERLEKAIAACGTEKCSAGLRAQLKRDLGVVQIGGQLDKDKGIGNLAEALKLDPAIALDPDLRTKDLDAAFAEAKKRAAGGAATKGPAATTAGQPTGDFVHDPVPEQHVRTAIPIYAEYSGEETLVKVIARYKGFGMTDWKPVELKKSGEKGWAGLLPCGDVQQGTTQYYIQGFNEANDPVAVGGDRTNAYKVKVKTEKIADPPHLPGQPPPSQCADTGDCPPNFPGCKKTPVAAATVVGPPEPAGKDGGEFCEEDADCKSKECKASKCTEPKHESSSKGRRIWIGASIGVEFQFVPSADDVCRLNPPNAQNPLTPTNTSNYYCVNGNGTDYPYRPFNSADSASVPGQENARLVQGQSDKVGGGGAFANVRLLVSADYALSMNLLLGVRLGYVANTHPGQAASDDGKSFPPIHAELRGTYLLGAEALEKKIAPYVMLGAGIATFEAAVKVRVDERPVDVTPVAGVTPRNVQKEVDAWHLAGPFFLTAGGGVRVGLSPRTGLLGGLRINYALGTESAFSVGPELGLVFGF